MKIGTRGSALALAQANMIVKAITDELDVIHEVIVIKTRGDRIIDRPLRELEGRGFFTKEIEEALLDGRIDAAVHSFKDMPLKAPEGLVVAAVTERENPSDLLIIRPEAYTEDIAPPFYSPPQSRGEYNYELTPRFSRGNLIFNSPPPVSGGGLRGGIK